MIFSSISFLYYFLPLVLLIYYISKKRYRNFILLIASLFFYFYGEPKYIIVLIISCIFNYYSGKVLENINPNFKKYILIFNLIINFGILFYFKYFNFFLDNINSLLNTNLTFSKIIMPIGISFFTFQATSYIIDIYKGKIKGAKKLSTFATYLTLFPQLIAGPIVRYETILNDLENRQVNTSLFAGGIKRFILGLSKKVMLANILGEFSKAIALIAEQTVLSYWCQAISNTLQIYFDFSGYSDMAIGLGLMFGFKFLENFNYPFIASSITEFWHRWHISLSTWFKDYLYIPLGGSRVGNLKRYINIFIVWMATGLWHGASWNFILWGLYFALFLIIEKIFLLNFLKHHKFIGHFYTMLLVIISFVIFNTENVNTIIIFIKGMFGFLNTKIANTNIYYYLNNYFAILLISIVFCGPWIPNFIKKLKENIIIKKIFEILEPVIYIFLLIISTAFIIDESFNPFLYFRF